MQIYQNCVRSAHAPITSLYRKLIDFHALNFELEINVSTSKCVWGPGLNVIKNKDENVTKNYFINKNNENNHKNSINLKQQTFLKFRNYIFSIIHIKTVQGWNLIIISHTRASNFQNIFFFNHIFAYNLGIGIKMVYRFFSSM